MKAPLWRSRAAPCICRPPLLGDARGWLAGGVSAGCVQYLGLALSEGRGTGCHEVGHYGLVLRGSLGFDEWCGAVGCAVRFAGRGSLRSSMFERGWCLVVRVDKTERDVHIYYVALCKYLETREVKTYATLNQSPSRDDIFPEGLANCMPRTFALAVETTDTAWRA